MWANYHMHTHYCDGKGTPSDYAAAAIYAGARTIGFSSHAPLPFPCAWCMRAESFPSYDGDVDELKHNSHIQVYKGLEVDYVSGVIGPADFKKHLDYTIGSVHFVEAFRDGRYWEIDNAHNIFVNGLNEIFNGDIKAAISRYYEITREMLLNSTPEIVGHLDKIKIHNPDDKYFNESDGWYRNEVEKTLQTIQQTGVIVEVNTRGLYQKKSSTTYPSPWILEKIHALKIPITLSSDAHHPKDIFALFTEAATMLNTIGFRAISILIDGNWQAVNLTPHGITY